jgi:hypothetical protein
MDRRQTSSGTTFFLKDASVEYKGTSAQETILDAAAPIYADTPQRLVVTSANDGTHMTGSLHYADRALDLRVWHLSDPAGAARELQRELGDDFDVVHEGTHIHVEYDPD